MTAVDTFKNNKGAISQPITAGEAIDLTSVDYVPATVYPRAICVGAAGTVKVDLLKGGTVTLTLPAGITWVRYSKVYKTGTAATGLVACW